MHTKKRAKFFKFDVGIVDPTQDPALTYLKDTYVADKYRAVSIENVYKDFSRFYSPYGDMRRAEMGKRIRKLFPTLRVRRLGAAYHQTAYYCGIAPADHRGDICSVALPRRRKSHFIPPQQPTLRQPDEARNANADAPVSISTTTTTDDDPPRQPLPQQLLAYNSPKAHRPTDVGGCMCDECWGNPLVMAYLWPLRSLYEHGSL